VKTPEFDIRTRDVPSNSILDHLHSGDDRTPNRTRNQHYGVKPAVDRVSPLKLPDD